MAVHQIHARTMEHVSQGKADLSCANVQLILKAYSARKQVLLKVNDFVNFLNPDHAFKSLGLVSQKPLALCPFASFPYHPEISRSLHWGKAAFLTRF